MQTTKDSYGQMVRQDRIENNGRPSFKYIEATNLAPVNPPVQLPTTDLKNSLCAPSSLNGGDLIARQITATSENSNGAGKASLDFQQYKSPAHQ